MRSLGTRPYRRYGVEIVKDLVTSITKRFVHNSFVEYKICNSFKRTNNMHLKNKIRQYINSHNIV